MIVVAMDGREIPGSGFWTGAAFPAGTTSTTLWRWSAWRTARSDTGAVGPGLTEFAGVPHRIEKVAVKGGITWVNDSKSTNPDSLRVALEAAERP